nr:hypothetical protein [Tanacetum cinerariifolium]
MKTAQQDDDVADEGAASVAVDDVPAAVDEPSIPSPTPTTQPPPPSQDLPSTSQVQPTTPTSLIVQPPLPQKQPQPSQPSHDAKISMGLLHTLIETFTTLTRRVEHLEQDKIAQSLEITKLKQRVKKLKRRNKLKVSKLRRLKKGGIIANIDANEDVTLKDVAADEMKENADVQGRQAESQAQIYQIDLEHADKVLSMQDDEVEPAELQEVVEVVTTAKLMTEVVTAASATITAAVITTAPSAARRRKGVVIRDLEETATPSIIIHAEPNNRRYPLTRFTLDQMPNNVRLEVKEESEVSLELLRFVRQQQQEGFRPEQCLDTSSVKIKIKTKIKQLNKEET